jgi:hypothetical protein
MKSNLFIGRWLVRGEPGVTNRGMEGGVCMYRALSRGVEGRRTRPAAIRSATYSAVATSFHSSLPSPAYAPLSPRKLTPAALPPRSMANRRARPRTDGNEPSIGFMPCVADCRDSKVHTRALQTKRTTRIKQNAIPTK